MIMLLGRRDRPTDAVRDYANCLSEADNLLDGLALHPQGQEQRGYLRVRAIAGEHFCHHFARLGTRQRLAAIRNALEGIEEHKLVINFDWIAKASLLVKIHQAWILYRDKTLLKLINSLPPYRGNGVPMSVYIA